MADPSTNVTQDPKETEQTPAAAKPATVSSRSSTTAPSTTPLNPRPYSMGRFKFLVVSLLLVSSLGTGFLGGWLGARGHENATSLSGNTVASQQRVVASESRLIASIAKNVGPSVVSIDVVGQATSSRSDIFGFGYPSTRQTQAAGTGIIISSDGLILTNRHVVPAGSTSVSVTLSDGTSFDNVKVVGRTNDSDSLDVAFLKIQDTKGKKLTPAEIGDSSKVQVGDVVVAIGNALGEFSNTVTSGIISGYGRSVQAGDESGGSVESLNDLFQTDAAINSGNSGGPLVNTSGQVIGINTAVAGEGQNIGFAIPIGDVNGLIKQVLSTGKFQRSYLGVRYVPLTSATAKQLNLNVSDGAYITPSADDSNPAIIAGSPAEKAGLRERDVITEVDGTKIDQEHSLTSLVGRKAVGDNVKLTVIRDGKTITLTAKVGAAPTDQSN